MAEPEIDAAAATVLDLLEGGRRTGQMNWRCSAYWKVLHSRGGPWPATGGS